MALWSDTTRRNLQPELMDQPGLSAAEHRQALAGLRRINAISGSARIVGAPIWRLARERSLDELRVLDIATGGGDVPLALWRAARRRGLKLHVVGADFSPVAVELANERAAAERADVKFIALDALTDPLPSGFDVVMSSLFLHHLGEDDARRLMRKMADTAQHLMLINDLRRSTAGYLLAQFACRALSRSPIVHVDGPRSVAGAFSLGEIATLAEQAELSGYTLTRRWPQRFLFAWRPTPSRD